MGSSDLMGEGDGKFFQLKKMKRSRRQMHKGLNVLNATELSS